MHLLVIKQGFGDNTSKNSMVWERFGEISGRKIGKRLAQNVTDRHE